MNWLFSFFRAVWQIMCNMAVGPTLPPLPDPEPIPEPDWEDEDEDDNGINDDDEEEFLEDWLGEDDEEVEEDPEPEPEPVVVRDHCVDMANFWLSDPVDDEIARIMMLNIKKQGFTGVIAGSQVPSVGNQQVKAALAMDMWADGYHYVRFKDDYMQNVNWADYAFQDVKGFVWLDLEETPPDEMIGIVGSRGVMLNYVALMVEELEARGYIVGIYTRRFWWLDYMGDTTHFSHLPLWCTDWGGSGPYDAAWWEANKFGGWAAPVWVQYAPDTDVAGVNVDLNERFVA